MNSFEKAPGRPKAIFLDVKPAWDPKMGWTTKSANANRDSVMLYGARDSLYSAANRQFITDVIFKSIRPVFYFLKMIGVFPITRKTPGRAYFKFCSKAYAYSILFFAGFLAYGAFVAYVRIGIISGLEGRFEESVIAYLFLVNILPILLIPIMWAEARKIAAVLNDWIEFEILFYQVAGRPIPLDFQQRGLLLAILLPILSITSVVVTHVTMVDFRFFQVIPYCILDNLTVMIGAFWYLMCHVLSKSAFVLAEYFQKALKHIGPAAMVADYRSLWLRLSKLTRDTGTSACYTMTYLNLYLFFIITLSIYGLMSQMSAGFGVKDIGLAVTALSNIFLLFFVCDEAHFASQSVRTNFQKRLLMVELSWMNSDAQTEINMFLRATEINPSDINCGGFFDVNRNLFKSLLTTMVTYLVVLLQFQISIPAEGQVDANMTRKM